MQNNKVYFHNLDGLRFLAFLSVFVSHAVLFFGYNNDSDQFNLLKKLFFVNGDLGVIFFFVLSGFLLTYLFFQEKKTKGDIDLKAFYKKRIVRILPVYLTAIILGFFVVPFVASFFNSDFPFSTRFDIHQIFWYLFFSGNLHMSFFSAPNLIVAILWFVAAQEQFYLFWPAIIKYFSAKNIFYSTIFIILGSFIFRLFFVYNYNITHYFTLSVISDIAIGALFAYMVEYLPKIKQKFVDTNRYQISFLYLVIILMIPFKGLLPELASGNLYRLIYALLPVIFGTLFAFVIMEQTYSNNSIFKLGQSKVLTYLGKISYGLYAYHIVALFAVLAFMKMFGVHTKYDDLPTYSFVIISTFILTIIFAQISFKYFEQKFLKFKTKFANN